MPDWKLTDFMSFHPTVQKFQVAKGPENAKQVFLCIGPGGKGSEYVSMTPPEAQELAEYLIVEVNRAKKAAKAK